MRSGLLEVPAQLVDRLASEWRHQLVPDDLLRSLADVGKLRWHDDPERPRGQRAKKRGVALQEQAEVVQSRVEDDVDDDAAAGQVDADRQAFREVPGGPRIALADGDVRQVLRLDPGQRRQVRGLLLGGPEPHELGSSTMASSTISRWIAWFSVNGRRSRLSASPMAA